MGYIRHDAIVATSWKTEHLVAAREKAVSLGLPCSEIVKSKINGYVSFLIAPDGSKEGWTDSDEGDAARDAWKAWMRADEDIYVDWAHVNFGGDDDDASTRRDHSGVDSEAGGGGAELAGDSAATKQSGAGSQNARLTD